MNSIEQSSLLIFCGFSVVITPPMQYQCIANIFKKMITKTISIIVKKGWKYKLTQTICIVFLFLFFFFFYWSTIHKAYLYIRTIILFLFFLWQPTITRPLFVTKKTLLSKLNTLTNMHTHITNNLKHCKCRNSFSPPKFSPHHI